MTREGDLSSLGTVGSAVGVVPSLPMGMAGSGAAGVGGTNTSDELHCKTLTGYTFRSRSSRFCILV